MVNIVLAFFLLFGHLLFGGWLCFFILGSFLGDAVSFCLCGLLFCFFSLSTLFSFATLLLHLCGLLFSVFGLLEFSLTLDFSALFVACYTLLFVALLLLGSDIIPLVVGESLEFLISLELVELLLDGFIVEVVVTANADNLLVADNLDVFADISLLVFDKSNLVVVKI